MKFKKVKKRVENLLKTVPYLRDNDYKLQSTIWKMDLKRMGYFAMDIPLSEFLILWDQGKFTNPESIRRSRALIQKEKPELRGESYKGRNTEQVVESLQELGYIN